MDLPCLTEEQLLLFFRCNKTKMSSLENPDTFLRQLRDHNLIPEDKFKEAIKMKSKKKIEGAVYDILEWLEENRSEHIRGFWICVSEEFVLKQNPTMKQLWNSLFSQSLHYQPLLPERIGSAEKRKRSGSSLSVHEETQAKSAEKRSTVQTSEIIYSDEEQPGSSSHVSQVQKKKSKESGLDFPLENLPVTCGEEAGKLDKERLAKGETCIVAKGQWYTPAEFEKLAGKESCRKWKSSIRCMGTTLGGLIEEGCLKAGNFPRVKRSTDHHLSHSSTAAEEQQQLEQVEMEQGNQLEPSPDHFKNIFEVRCADLSGFLHKKRFASGSLGKSIRTDTCWMTPRRFVRQALDWKDASWKTDIMYEGKPLSLLIEAEVLQIHPPMCRCRLCGKQPEDLEVQNNDDECNVCGSGEGELLRCGRCPRTFHQRCHSGDDAAARKNESWVCNLCVFKANEEQSHSDE